MTSRLRFVLLAVIVLGLAGCGGGSAREVREEITPADQARAEAFAPTVIDFPAGWRGDDAEAGGGDEPRCRNLDLSRLTASGSAERNFALDGGTVAQSNAIVFSVVSDAVSAYEQFVRAAASGCLVQGGEDQTKTVRRLSVPRIAQATAAFEVVFNLPTSLPDASPVTYFNLIFLRQGRGFSLLTLIEFGSPFDATVRRHLARRVAERMRLVFP